MSRRLNAYVTSTTRRRADPSNDRDRVRNGQRQSSWKCNSTVNVAVMMSIVCLIAVLNLQRGDDSHSTSPRKTLVHNQQGGAYFVEQASLEAPLQSKNNRIPRKGTRPRVSKTEFFGKSPPQDVLDEYFQFEPIDWQRDKNRLRLRPAWQCTQFPSDGKSQPSTKFIVLQMFRSESSTLRAFFRAYTAVCGRSMALVSQCVDLGVEFMQGKDIWRSGKTSPRAATDCWLTSAVDRQGNALSSNPEGMKDRVNTAFLQEHDFDILAGSLPLGSHESWLKDYSHEVRIQHIVMLRDPLEKFISHCLTLNKAKNDLTVEQAVALVNRTASAKLDSGTYFQSLCNYLITPQQRDWVYREFIEWTPEQMVNLALSNIFMHNILVGMADRLAETVQMLAFVLDKEHEVSNLVTYFSSTEKLKATKSFTRMDNEYRTKAIAEAIRRDDMVSVTLGKFLQYEQEIYDAARKLHLKQYEWMQEDIKNMEFTKNRSATLVAQAATELKRSE